MPARNPSAAPPPLVGFSGQAVRQVIHAFNRAGLGRRRRSTRDQTLYYCVDAAAQRLRAILHRRPRLFGKATSVWTLALAAAVAYEQGLTAWRVSDQTVRASLARMGVGWRRAQHGITSPDPEYARKKARRERLVRLAAAHPAWLLGFADAVWGSRLARPARHAWQDADHPLRLLEQPVAPGGPAPKARACHGLLARAWDDRHHWTAARGLRFGDGRPVSALTIAFRSWCAAQAAALGKRAILLIWDNASWHESQIVRTTGRSSSPARASGCSSPSRR